MVSCTCVRLPAPAHTEPEPLLYERQRSSDCKFHSAQLLATQRLLQCIGFLDTKSNSAASGKIRPVRASTKCGHDKDAIYEASSKLGSRDTRSEWFTSKAKKGHLLDEWNFSASSHQRLTHDIVFHRTTCHLSGISLPSRLRGSPEQHIISTTRYSW